MSQKKYVSLSKLSTFLDNLYEKFASIGHKHTLSDITNYAVDSQLSSTSTNPVQNKILDAEFEAISVAMNALEDAIDGKSNASHDHDGIYYTEAEIDTKLASKSDTTHKHDGVYDTKGAADAVQKNLNAVSDTLGAHTGNSDIHVTAANKTNWNAAYTHSQAAHARVDATKVADSTTNGNILINGTETNVYSHPNSGVTAGTYKSVTVNAQGHVTAGSNPTTLSGYGITDAETKSDASAKLTEAKTYADNAAKAVKNDLLNGAGTAYDTLKELGDLIDNNVDAIEALEKVAAGKADKTHVHAISDITNLQSTLDGKAAKSEAANAQAKADSAYDLADLAANMVYVGPDMPTDPNVKVWINTAEEGTGVVPIMPRVSTINLLASAWSGSSAPYSQRVNIATVTAATKVELNATVAQIVSLQNDDIALMAENNDGIVTVYSFGGKPDSNMTMQVTLTEVAYV